MTTPAFDFDVDTASWLTADLIPFLKSATYGPEPIAMPTLPSLNSLESPDEIMKAEQRRHSDHRRQKLNRERVARGRKRKGERLGVLEMQHGVLISDNIQLRVKLQKHGEETLSTEEKNVLHSQHVSLLGEMVSLWSSPDALAQQASTFWNESATMIQSSGIRTGADEIVEFYYKLNSLCQHKLVVTDYSVECDMDSVRKPRVVWSMDLTLTEIWPVLELAESWSIWSGKTLNVTGFSVLTFQDGKIVQDIQTLDILSLMVEMHRISSNPSDVLPLLHFLFK